MDGYVSRIKELHANRKLGQNFLVSDDIASMESEYASGRIVVELGPGLGILTKELCKKARLVIAVERDVRLYELLSSEFQSKNLKLVKGDFFKQEPSIFEGCEIMVANIPYNLSSKTVSWLFKMKMEALLCIQKEFAERMLAESGTRQYSKLSVMSQLMFNTYPIMRVPRNNFYPVPRVDSMLVYLKPKPVEMSVKTIDMISLIMEHKKKSLRNAVVDSIKQLGITRQKALDITDPLENKLEKVFKMSPDQIAASASRMAAML